MPCSSLQPRAELSAGLLERKPGPGPPRGKGNAARKAHPRSSASISPHLSDVNKPGPQSETFRAPAVALVVCPLPGSAARGQVWGRGSGGAPAPSPSDCVIGPRGGCSGPAPRRDAEARPGDPAAGAAPGGVGGMGRTVVPPPGTAPGRQGEPRR